MYSFFENITNIEDILNCDKFIEKMNTNIFVSVPDKMFVKDILTEYYTNKVKIYIDRNVYYNMKTKSLYLYDGTISSKIVKHKYVDNYQITQTKSGSIYVTVCPTYFHT